MIEDKIIHANRTRDCKLWKQKNIYRYNTIKDPKISQISATLETKINSCSMTYKATYNVISFEIQ